MRRFRQVTEPEDLWELLQEVQEWSYPREISGGEFAFGEWWRWGDDLVCWFVRFQEHADTAFLHIVSNPSSAGTFNTRRFFLAMELFAEERGYDKLAIDLSTELSEETKKHQAYCQRLGFCENAKGWWVRELL